MVSMNYCWSFFTRAPVVQTFLSFQVEMAISTLSEYSTSNFRIPFICIAVNSQTMTTDEWWQYCITCTSRVTYSCWGIVIVVIVDESHTGGLPVPVFRIGPEGRQRLVLSGWEQDHGGVDDFSRVESCNSSWRKGRILLVFNNHRRELSLVLIHALFSRAN